MISNEQLLGMLLIKGKFNPRVQVSETSTIGYSVVIRSSISTNLNMMNAIKRSLNQLRVPYGSDGEYRIVFGKAGSLRLLEIIPKAQDSLNAGLPRFRRIAELVQENKHKTLEGLEEILKLMGHLNGLNEHE